MRITVALGCSIVSVALALLLHSWLRSRKGSGKDNARIFAIVRGRISNFRSFQAVPVIIFAIVVTAAVGIGVGWEQAAFCLAGAVTSVAALAFGSVSFSDGVTAAYNEASGGDIRQSARASYRTGAVLSLWIAGTCLAVICAMFLLFKSGKMISSVPYFALGAAVSAMIIHTGGDVYTSAYSLAVPSSDFTDRSGSFSGAGSDLAGSFIISAASAVMLAELGVVTSGVTSTFTASAAARFPILVYGAAAVGTIAGIFLYRPGIGNDFSKGAGGGCIAAGIITAGISVYLSVSMLQSRVYAWAVTAGIAAALILSAVSRLFSSDSKLFITGYKTDRNLGRYTSVVFNLGSGMIATAVYTLVLTAAIAVSYMFANFYGVALCAVGMTAVAGSVTAVSGFVSVGSSASDIIAVQKHGDDQIRESVTNLLDSATSRNLVSAKACSDISGTMTSLAAFCALFYLSGIESIDIMSLRVFCGIIAGVAGAFILSGMIISSVRITGRVALRDIGKNDDDTGATSALRGAVLPAVIAIALPTVIGLFIGVKALAAFNAAAIVTGYMLITCTNYSGMYYENTSLQSLSSLLKMMAVFSVAFLPVFMKVGGFLLQ